MEKKKYPGKNESIRNKNSKADRKPPAMDVSMASESDPLGSYTGVPIGNPFETPVQDADDL